MAGSDLYGSEHFMKQLTEGSMFSGIMGFGEGLRQAGFRNLWAIEKEPFCQAVIRSRFPETELLTDVRDCGKRNLRAVDVLTAGFPCQDLSVAGKRAGLGGARSGLFWQVVRILGELGPAWFVLENVPGLFSSNEGRDFAVVLNALDELGYGLAWRVLNSQFFGVAQRRRRVFIVGRFGKPCPAEVLFEPQSSGWDIAEGGEARADIAVPLTSGSGVTSNRPGRRAEDDYNLAFTLPSEHRGVGNGHNTNYIASQISASAGHHGHSSPRGDGSDNLVATYKRRGGFGWSETDDVTSTLECQGGRHQGGSDATPIVIQDARGQRDKRQNGIGIQEGGPSYTLDGTSQHAVAFAENQRGELRTSDVALSISVGGGKPGRGYPAALCKTAHSDRVRDFTGLPQGLDSARYRALGNAVTAKVAYWIGKRIIEAAQKEQVSG